MRCRAWWLGRPDSEATGEVRFAAIMARRDRCDR